MRRSTTRVSRPPSQKLAKSTCNQIAVIAALCVELPPAWPCSESGMRPITASTVTNPSTVTLRTAKHSTVSAAPINVVVSQARPSALVVKKSPSDWPNAWLRLGGVLAALLNTRIDDATEATVQTAAPAAARSIALPNSASRELSANTPSARAPRASAIDRSTTSLAIGTP